MEELEDLVSEVILTERAEDPHIKWLVRLAFNSIQTNRPVFPNPLDEPILWQKFFRMVENGIEDARQAQEEISRAQAEIAPKIPGLQFPQ